MAKEIFSTLEAKSPSGLTYSIFKDIKDSSVLKEEHIGKRVMVAGFKTTAKFWLKECHTQGDPQHPLMDAYTLNTGTGMTRCFYAHQCRLHPAEYRKGKRWQR